MNVMIIPAAGRGTRLDFDGPKLMFPLGGKPLIAHLLARFDRFIEHFVIVINPSDEGEVVPYLEQSGYSYELAYQSSPTGMLDAILAPIDQLRNRPERPEQLWISWCDQVGLSEQTAMMMQRKFVDAITPCLIFPTVDKPDPYIHMQRNKAGRIVHVMQRREGDDMPPIGENDCGFFGLSESAYFDLLPQFAASLSLNSSQDGGDADSSKIGANTKERNFLPFISWMEDKGSVTTYPAANISESIGINTIEDAAKLLGTQ